MRSCVPSAMKSDSFPPCVSMVTISPISGCSRRVICLSDTSADTIRCGRMFLRCSANLSRVSLCSCCSFSSTSTNDWETNSPSVLANGRMK